MEKQIEDSSSTILLRPTFTYWVNNNLLSMVVTMIVLVLCCCFFRNHEYLKYVGVIICLYLICRMFYSFMDILVCTSWLITKEQIKITKGVFSKKINYIELYRVFDYEEKQSFIQALTNNTTILIFSGDNSTPKLEIVGIEANTDIIKKIRDRVEIQKKSTHIYEMTNNNRQ